MTPNPISFSIYFQQLLCLSLQLHETKIFHIASSYKNTEGERGSRKGKNDEKQKYKGKKLIYCKNKLLVYLDY